MPEGRRSKTPFGERGDDAGGAGSGVPRSGQGSALERDALVVDHAREVAALRESHRKELQAMESEHTAARRQLLNDLRARRKTFEEDEEAALRLAKSRIEADNQKRLAALRDELDGRLRRETTAAEEELRQKKAALQSAHAVELAELRQALSREKVWACAGMNTNPRLVVFRPRSDAASVAELLICVEWSGWVVTLCSFRGGGGEAKGACC